MEGKPIPGSTTLDSLEQKVEETKKYLANNVTPQLSQSKETVSNFFSSGFSRFSTNLSSVTPVSVKKFVGVSPQEEEERPPMDNKQFEESWKALKKVTFRTKL
jgi:hypothetical protein